MKKLVAKYSSAVLTALAVLFVAVFKPFAHSPEIPQELKK